jgi:hypothetical protein
MLKCNSTYRSHILTCSHGIPTVRASEQPSREMVEQGHARTSRKRDLTLGIDDSLYFPVKPLRLSVKKLQSLPEAEQRVVLVSRPVEYVSWNGDIVDMVQDRGRLTHDARLGFRHRSSSF